MSDFEKLNLHEPFLKQLKNLINGNQAKSEDLTEISHEIYGFKATATVTWSFYGECGERKVAGGAQAQIHFASDAYAYEKHAKECLKDARTNKNLHGILLASLRQNAQNALAKASGATRYYDFKPFSVREECENCGGAGKIRCQNCGGAGEKTCASCGGRGRRSCSGCGGSGGINRAYTQYNSDGSSYTSYRYETCSSCGGSGSQTCFECSGGGAIRCSSCGGEGRVECGSCDAYGYFIITAQAYAYAKPAVSLRISSERYADELLNFLCAQSPKFISQTVPFSQEDESEGESSHIFVYEGSHAITRLDFRLFGKNYTAAGFSNPPYAFIRPPVFDDLFADELKMLASIDADGKVSRREAFKFFTRYCSQPALNAALKRIAAADAKDELKNAVQDACDGYISQGAAGKLAQTMKKCLDKISPVYSPAVWFGLGAMFWLFALVFTAGIFGENFASRYIQTPIYATVFLVVCAGVSWCVLTPLSAIVTVFRRRKVPKEYRQSMQNKQAFAIFRKILLVFWLAGAIYGGAASFGYAPTLMQLDEKFEASRSLEAKFREIKAKFDSARNDGEDEKGALRPSPPQTTPQTTRKEKILYIQRVVGAKADGIFGARTLKKAREFLDANLTDADEIYDAIKAKELSPEK